MPRFFIETAPKDGFVWIGGEDAHHMARVLRMKPGERLTACDGEGHDYDCVLETLAGGQAQCRVVESRLSAGEPNVEITLYMGLPKGDKMDFIVQKAVELGAACVAPFFAARSISRPEGAALKKKQERWQKIAREAAMQCGRGRIPQVTEVLSFSEAVRRAEQCDTALFLYENEKENSLRAVLARGMGSRVAILVGPEGGFAPEEVETVGQAGLASVSLGPRILRCETAPLAALTAVLYESGNL